MKKVLSLLILILFISLFHIADLRAQGVDTLIYGATDPEDIIDSGQLINTTWNLKVLLVEFSDVKHRNPEDDNLPEYTSTDWNDLFFSQWSYITPNKLCPDGKSVYGSMRDYFTLMSDGEFNLTGNIINPDADENGVPDWIVLPNTKAYYSNGSGYTFLQAAKNAAIAAGLDVSTGSATKLAIVYAGHTYRKKANGSSGINGLHPRSFGVEYVMGERFAAFYPYNQERTDAIFCGVGIHCHEFGHVLGFPDLYYGEKSNGEWDLMGSGNYNPTAISGTNNKWACAPAPLNPGLREAKGWVTFDNINSDVTFFADYDLKDPEIFKINNSANPSCSFIIENRNFEATMNFNGTVAYDYNHFVPWNRYNTKPDLLNQGLLIWARKSGSYYHLIQADGFNHDYPNPYEEYNRSTKDGTGTSGDSGDPFPGYWDIRTLSPWSFPSSLSNSVSPNSLPSSNIGMEIVNIGSNNMTVDLYYEYPVNASPVVPRFFDLSVFISNPSISWLSNSEPDFSHYEVWRASGPKPLALPLNFTLIATTTNNYYVDYSIYLRQRSGIPHSAFYKVKAVDNSNKKSTASNELSIDYNVEFGSGSGKKDIITQNAELLPTKIALNSNYPNPFNPSTTISFNLPDTKPVKLNIYSVTGQKVNTLVNENLDAGSYQVEWNGTNMNGSQVSSGVYIYELIAGNTRMVKKMFLAK